MGKMAVQEHEGEEDEKVVEGGRVESSSSETTPLLTLNHVSRLCRSVEATTNFYEKVLGFIRLNRPSSLDFPGSWLFNYGLGIHLVQKKHPGPSTDASEERRLDPMDNHISFQCEDMEVMERRLKDKGIYYIKRTINDEGAAIDQLFFKDPDGFMVEICNCENLELVPADSVNRVRLHSHRHNPPIQLGDLQTNSE